MQKIYFCLGIHNHQPVGNFDRVFEAAWEKSYKPFLETVLDFPNIRFSLHTTGCLVEWFEKHQPGYFELIEKLLEREQIELLGGAYYEPILPAISREDALEQFARMRKWLKERFGVVPRGAWLAERVWEPSLAGVLAEAGVEYAALDDDHFLSAGHRLEDLSGYYLTESGFGPIALFPIHKALRYAIPFQLPEKSLEYMRALGRNRDTPLFVMADDGEKFGLWPKTHDSVYRQGWLRNFFKTLQDHAHEIELLTFGEVRSRIEPAGRTYLPTSSYFEMGQWVLPPKSGAEFEKYLHEFEQRDDWESLRPFMRGGHWRSFLTKYDEANYLQKKMRRVSRKYYALSRRKRDPELLTPVLRGQCNCAYWHGIFGGLYLPHLRHAVWKEILLGEYGIDNTAHRGRKWVEARQTDHDADGHPELLIENAYMNAYLSLHKGGALFEWDYRPKGYNLLNTLTRREETYHRKLADAKTEDTVVEEKESASIHDLLLAKEENLQEHLHFDRWPRAALLDHFTGWNSTVDEFRTAALADYGTFLHTPYRLAEMLTDGAVLSCRGFVGNTPLELSKTITAVPGAAILKIHYLIRNLASHELHSPFGVEWNLSLLSGESGAHHISVPETGQWNRPLNQTAVHHDLQEVLLQDEEEGVAVRFSFDGPAKLWRVPVETVSLSESGFERVFQSVALMFLWELHLNPGQQWERHITAYLSEP